MNRRVTPEEIERIKELSPDHTLNEISKIMGIGRMTISCIQRNPKHGIVNPKREQVKRNVRKVAIEEYFDINAYAKLMAV